ncbi:hypothetical protein [Salegentibacter sp. Hel_I_6]|uniref:hypothetical protein n=1 Tax=Salegentibacter sp. Hel_I_6 TaxID=1250278 RepID=UPI00055AE8AE|nr:hypothetical protein [Salegentibacter sp. Hel_I_6]
MSRLTEKHIQKKAIIFLENHYRQKFEPSAIFSRPEVRTVKRYKKKRADGLLCFESPMQREHTISLEAKSHKTLGALIPAWNNKDLTFVLIIGIMTAFLSVYSSYALPWYWIILISILAFIIGVFLSFVILAIVEPDHFKSMSVVDQVHQYPANEKWIAVSKDSLNLATNKKTDFQRRNNYDNFLRIAKKNKVGILVISRWKEEILIEPGFFKGDYLDCYCIADSVRQEVFIKTIAS